MQLATVAQAKHWGWPWNPSSCLEQSCQIRLFKLIKPRTISGSPMLLFWPTSLYEIVLARGLLLILWLLLVTSCPVMIVAASWHDAAVIRNGHLRTGLKQRDGQSLCLKHIWAVFWCNSMSDQLWHPFLCCMLWHQLGTTGVSHPAAPSSHCSPQVVADTRGSKKLAAREPAREPPSFDDVLYMEEFCFNWKDFCVGNPLC